MMTTNQILILIGCLLFSIIIPTLISMRVQFRFSRLKKPVIEEYNGEFKYYFIDIEEAMLPGDSIRIIGIKYFSDDYKAKEYFDQWVINQPNHIGRYLLLRSI